jgi:uncharacterized pyridoxamine 5'-phosphate oxidase family protein
LVYKNNKIYQLADKNSKIYQLTDKNNKIYLSINEDCQTKVRIIEGVRQLFKNIIIDQRNRRFYIYLRDLLDLNKNENKYWTNRIEIVIKKLL